MWFLKVFEAGLKQRIPVHSLSVVKLCVLCGEAGQSGGVSPLRSCRTVRACSLGGWWVGQEPPPSLAACKLYQTTTCLPVASGWAVCTGYLLFIDSCWVNKGKLGGMGSLPSTTTRQSGEGSARCALRRPFASGAMAATAATKKVRVWKRTNNV